MRGRREKEGEKKNSADIFFSLTLASFELEHEKKKKIKFFLSETIDGNNSNFLTKKLTKKTRNFSPKVDQKRTHIFARQKIKIVIQILILKLTLDIVKTID